PPRRRPPPHRGAAAPAPPADVASGLQWEPDTLADLLVRFARGEQVPERISVDPQHHMDILRAAIGAGEGIDAELGRVAALVRTAGNGAPRPPGFVGPWMPSRILSLDDAALQSAVSAWLGPTTADVSFRKGAGGAWEVRGPDGNWFRMVDSPPPGALPLAQVEKTVDFANPDFGMVLSAFILIGLTGGQTQPMDRAAPPEAYQKNHFHNQGTPVPAPPRPALSQPVRPPVLGDASVSKIEAIGLVQGGLAEAAKGMSA